MFIKKTLIAVVWIIAVASTASAGWVDDWVDQHTTTSPGFFEGQKRGYFSGGSFSARWKNSTDYPVTVEMPKLKTGCGGIDVFAGGLSFLDTDYLVQKLQNILQMAPAVAFDIALSTLCEECSNSLSRFEGIVNQLNSLQLSDCKASRAMVATIMKPGVSDPNKAAELGVIQADFAQSTGLYDLYNEWQNISAGNSDGGDPDVATAFESGEAMTGCPADLLEIFGEDGLVIERVASKFGMPDYAGIIRGYAGDVRIESASKLFQVSYIPPCEGNEKKMDAFLTGGDVMEKDIDGNCTVITDTNRDLRQWVSDRMTTIADGMRTNTALSPDDESFLNNVPIPVYPSLKNAVGTDQEGAMISLLSDVTAKSYAWALVSDLLYRTRALLLKTQRIWAAQEGSSSGAAHQCIIHMVESDAPLLIAEMIEKIDTMAGDLRSEYLKALEEVNTAVTFAERTRRFDITVKKVLASKFGREVADRITGDTGG